MGRASGLVRRGGPQGRWPEHPLPDRLGAALAARIRAWRLRVRTARRRVSAFLAERRRRLAGRVLDRYRLPESLLSSLPSLRDVLSALGSRGVSPPGECMRFPLHLTTDTIRLQMRNAVKGNNRYPFVLMLEPLY